MIIAITITITIITTVIIGITTVSLSMKRPRLVVAVLFTVRSPCTRVGWYIPNLINAPMTVNGNDNEMLNLMASPAVCMHGIVHPCVQVRAHRTRLGWNKPNMINAIMIMAIMQNLMKAILNLKSTW